MTYWQTTILFLAFLALPACGDDNGPGTPDCPSCPAPFQCIDGVCTDPCDLGLVACGDLDCSGGKCICPDGYEGDNCDVEKTPTRVQFEEIWVYDFPLENPEGGVWDGDAADGTGPNPDIYPWVAEMDNQRTYRGLTVYDAAAGDTLYFDLRQVGPAVYEIEDPMDRTGFQLWDRDLNPDDDDYFSNVSGQYILTPYEPGRRGFPVRDTIQIGEVATVVISYRFD